MIDFIIKADRGVRLPRVSVEYGFRVEDVPGKCGRTPDAQLLML